MLVQVVSVLPFDARMFNRQMSDKPEKRCGGGQCVSSHLDLSNECSCDSSKCSITSNYDMEQVLNSKLCGLVMHITDDVCFSNSLSVMFIFFSYDSD